MKVRILIADDHRMFRHALRLILEGEPDFEVVEEASDGQELLRAVHKANPHVVCMDISMPMMDGIEATRRLIAIKPGIKVIGLSAFADQYYVTELMNAGAVGYVTKGEAAEEIVRAIHTVYNSQKKYLCPDIASSIVDAMSTGHTPSSQDAALSYRERQVLQLVAEGCTSLQIAENLHLSTATVEVHRRNIMRKLDIHSVANLTRYAIRKGIVAG